ncbi:MAG: fructosamine kinase family protein [Flavobacteriales bacterium]
MSLPGSLVECLAKHISDHLARPVDIEECVVVGGGSINDAYRLETNEGRYFVKVNQADRYPSFFAAEADGLGRIGATSTMRVPRVIAVGEDHDDSYLLLEWIASGPKTPAFWSDFGRSLAALHRHTAPAFGLERDNYIGTLVQRNTEHPGWTEFFVQCRLEPMVAKARDRKRLGGGDVLRFERLYAQLDALFPTEAPALLHGDLWNGNFMCGADAKPVLIDPAVYHGHREMDIAMSTLFGGFDPGFIAAYDDAWPLEQGWRERVDLCNLYPLLVHVNLFGGGYVQQVQAVLKRFT